MHNLLTMREWFVAVVVIGAATIAIVAEVIKR